MNKTMKIFGIGAAVLFFVMASIPATLAIPPGGYPPYMEPPSGKVPFSPDDDCLDCDELQEQLNKIRKKIKDVEAAIDMVMQGPPSFALLYWQLRLTYLLWREERILEQMAEQGCGATSQPSQ